MVRRSSSRYYWVLPSFSGFLIGVTWFDEARVGITGFYLVLPSFDGYFLVGAGRADATRPGAAVLGSARLAGRGRPLPR